jgi:hypothetical protein
MPGNALSVRASSRRLRGEPIFDALRFALPERPADRRFDLLDTGGFHAPSPQEALHRDRSTPWQRPSGRLCILALDLLRGMSASVVDWTGWPSASKPA